MNDIISETVKPNKQAGSYSLNYTNTRKLSPILKWAGGKEQELKYILPNLPPQKFQDYYEPFVGGGSVYTAIQADGYFINDKSEELITLYRCFTNGDRGLFFKILDETIHNWSILTEIVLNHKGLFIETYKQYSTDQIDDDRVHKILCDFLRAHTDQFIALVSSIYKDNTQNFIKEIEINLFRKVKRMKALEKLKNLLPDKDILDNIETAFKSGFYMHIRHIYNNQQQYGLQNALKSAVFLFIRNFAYSGMFRYNSKGEFNVPYGGIGYNRKNFRKKVDYLKTKELRSLLDRTEIENEDFETFFKKHNPSMNDFVFLDPPYDSEFSTYANNAFTREDQQRLADYLIKECQAKWMMIIKNTDFIFNLYNDRGLNIRSFKKNYLVSFMNRNDKNVEHLLITNY